MKKPRIKKRTIYLTIMLTVIPTIALLMERYDSFWIRYSHLIFAVAVFVYLAIKINIEDEKENEDV